MIVVYRHTTEIITIQTKRNVTENLNWQEANQLVIYKCGPAKSWSWDCKQILLNFKPSATILNIFISQFTLIVTTIADAASGGKLPNFISPLNVIFQFAVSSSAVLVIKKKKNNKNN